MFRIIQSLSLAGGEKNIDLIRTSDNCVLLLDGSTPLVESKYDASQFVMDFANAFFDRLQNRECAPAAVGHALSDIYALFKKAIDNDDVDLYPSACLTAAYISEGMLHIISIGDTVALVIMKDGTVKTVTCHDVSRLDRAVISKAMEMRKAFNMDICDVMKRPEIKQMLINNRKMMNKANGYKILAFGMPDVDDHDIHVFNANEVERIVMHSDGFDGYADRLAANDASLDQIYRLLRCEENADPRLNETPRFKVSDDASAIIFDIVPD